MTTVVGYITCSTGGGLQVVVVVIHFQHTFDARLLTVQDKGTPYLVGVVTMTTVQSIAGTVAAEQ